MSSYRKWKNKGSSEVEIRGGVKAGTSHLCLMRSSTVGENLETKSTESWPGIAVV